MSLLEEHLKEVMADKRNSMAHRAAEAGNAMITLAKGYGVMYHRIEYRRLAPVGWCFVSKESNDIEQEAARIQIAIDEATLLSENNL